MQKCQFSGFLKPMFLLFRKASFLYKTSEIVFHDLFSRSIAWEYRELQGLTGGYKGLQGVTGGDQALQEVTKDYRNFSLTRTFPDTFSWSILHRNQS